MKDTVKIIIADDHELFVNGLHLLLKDQPGLMIVDVAKDGNELLQVLQKSEADIILLDLNMPGLTGFDVVPIIRQHYKNVRVIILSTYDQEHIIRRSMDLGVDGYLLKNSSKDELLKAIYIVMNNGTYYMQPLEIKADNFDENTGFIKKTNLTKREIEITSYIKAGFTNNEIAEKLFLSIYTVETHRKNIMQKLGLKSPSALIKFIMENSL